jgi:hypothetical protein
LWFVYWDNGTCGEDFIWTESEGKFLDLVVDPPPAASTEPMTDRERLLALRAREGRDGGYGFVT